VLLKIDGQTILTDPVFSVRAGLSIGIATLGVKRLVAPALPVKELPKIDLILLSHAHMDHFDRPSLRMLESKGTHVVTAYRTSDLLRADKYASVNELRWSEQHRVHGHTITALEVNHWGARMQTDVYRGFNGYLIETPNHRVIFAGDTAYTDAFRRVPGSGRVDLAIMPIGAYDPWIRFHCNPEQAWRMAQDAGADRVLPVHHSTFQLSREPLGEPVARLHRAAGRESERIVATRIGEEFHD
jgi:L-ascorbate metabolism protein UlaG (beta-lactamase superfamily)